MLGINVNIDIRDVHFPIYFDHYYANKCVHCGAEGSMYIVDKFGREQRNPIHAFDHMECKACGQKYSIKWIDVPGDNRKHPCAVDPSIARQFTNFVSTKIDRIMGKI